MDFQTMQRQLRAAKLGRSMLLTLAVVMLLLNSLLTVKLYSSSNQVILIPTSIRDGMVARGGVDVAYLEALALDVVYGFYNASASTQAYGRARIERMASIKDQAALLARYDEVAKDYLSRKISTTFEVQIIERNLETLEIKITGLFTTYLDTVRSNSEPRSILLTFVPEAGSVRLSKINLVEVTT